MKRYLALILLPIFMYASIGEITVLSGDVKIKRDAQTLQGKVGSKLEKNDFISTDKDGKVQIVFSDKTIFTIGKNSTLDIADYLYDESQPKKNAAQFNVLKGAFSSITGKIGKLNKSKFKLKTKSASIGIRGTIVKANQTEVMCTEGAITVETLNGATVRVEAGEKTVISNGTPSAPVSVTNEDIRIINEQAGVVDDIAAVEQNIQTEGKAQQEVQEADTEDQEQTEPEVNTEGATEVQKSDTQKTDELQNTIDTRSLTLEGRTIDSEGNRQTMEVQVDNLGGDLTLEGSNLQMVDDSGNAIDSTDNEVITWGHWADDPSKKWVAGQQTDVKVLQELETDTDKTVNAEYSGQVMGTVNGTDDIKIDEDNAVNIGFEFGQNTNTMDGSMKFKTETEQSWNSTFSGNVNSNTFESSTVGGSVIDSGATDAQSIDSGNVKGEFYGEDMDSVGGTFKLGTETDTATGVFKADKQ